MPRKSALAISPTAWPWSVASDARGHWQPGVEWDCQFGFSCPHHLLGMRRGTGGTGALVLPCLPAELCAGLAGWDLTDDLIARAWAVGPYKAAAPRCPGIQVWRQSIWRNLGRLLAALGRGGSRSCQVIPVPVHRTRAGKRFPPGRGLGPSVRKGIAATGAGGYPRAASGHAPP